MQNKSRKKRKLEKLTRAFHIECENAQKKIKQQEEDQQKDINEMEDDKNNQEQNSKNQNIKKQFQQQQNEEMSSEEDSYDKKQDLNFEEDFDDEYDEEDINQDNNDWVSDDDTDNQNQNLKEEQDQQQLQQEKPVKQKINKNQLQEEEIKINAKGQKKNLKTQEITQVKPWTGKAKDLKQDEQLEFDNRAYEMFHRATVEWPSMSLDYILPLNQQYNPKNPNYQAIKNYPLEIFVTMGTQSSEQNYIYLLKWSKLYKTKYDDESDHQDSENEDIGNDQEADIQIEQIEIQSSVNRIRAMNHMPVVAYWTEDGKFNIMDIKSRFQKLGGDTSVDPLTLKNANNKVNIKQFQNSAEGFALDWNFLKLGQLASGSCDKKVYIYQPKNQNLSDIVRDETPYTYHKGSVEDINWSFLDQNLFASCSTDRTVQIVDLRSGNKKQSQIVIQAHDCDVNVLSWCRINAELIASGGDDGSIKVWDKRYPKQPYSEIYYHEDPITSIQFQPNSDSLLSAQSADDRLTIWDLAAENDFENEKLQKQQQQQDMQQDEDEIPDQLMFIHQGQTEMKELRYHPMYYEMLISTSNDGIHVFKPALNDESVLGSIDGENQDKVFEISEKELDKYMQQMNLND